LLKRIEISRPVKGAVLPPAPESARRVP